MPGIARALQLAGRALNDDRCAELARVATYGVIARQRAKDRLESATVCHGKAGLLQFLLRTLQDTGDSGVRMAATQLTVEIIAGWDEDAPFGYQDIERHSGQEVRVNKAGVLEGAAGVALALCSAGSRRPPVWDYAFLLA